MEHFYKTCGENWFNYLDIYSKAVSDANENSHFVEVGSWKGMSSVYLAVEIINSKKNIKLDCIDLWGTVPGKIYGDKKDLYNTFIKNIEPVKDMINPIISNSWDAASMYEDHSLDFVWLDAGHEYEDIKKDIAAWYPKVKIGGTIAGHDFTTAPGVSKSVVEYFDKDYKRINTSWLHIKKI
jgi:predicted O-methyltransferase YrrM